MGDPRAQAVLERRNREITGHTFPMRLVVVTADDDYDHVGTSHFVINSQWVMTLYPDGDDYSAYVAIKGTGVN